MQLSLRRDIDTPLYRQIVNQIRDLIRSGALAPNHRLPTVRQLAADLGLTRLTVHSAYAELQSEGLIESHVGRGTFVAPDARSLAIPGRRGEPVREWASQSVLADLLGADEERNIISFAQAFPSPETYPMKELKGALGRAMDKPDSLSYGPIQGERELRDELAALFLERGLAVAPEHMLITAGAQQAIDIALRSLAGPGEVVLVEEPTYPGVLELATFGHRRVLGVPVDEQGIRIDALRAACETHRPRLLYLVPAFHNPTGSTLPPDRREAILHLARTHDLIVIEDDAYGFLSLDGPARPPLKSIDEEGRVVYVTSFSKLLAPALRLGALVASPALLPSLAAAKQSSDLVCSTLLQRAVADYLRRGSMGPHVQLVRDLYRERRAAMLVALGRHLPECSWTHPGGGLSLWVTLPDAVSERDFVRDALEAGVGVAPGRVFFADARAGGHMRLSYGVHSPERIEEGIATLGGVLRAHLQRRPEILSLAGRMVGPMV